MHQIAEPAATTVNTFQPRRCAGRTRGAQKQADGHPGPRATDQDGK